MQTITPPNKIEYNKKGDNKAEVIITPFYPGFGVTVGNSLRRVLLSSLEGSAIVGFKIAGVDHEFSAIENVKEDAVAIILNLKKVRIKLHEDSEEDVKLTLSANGKKTVTAGDIKKDARVEVLNPDQEIATLTDDKAKLEMEIFVRNGIGYVTVEQRDEEKLEIGTVAIDSLFSPVVNVGFKIENTRVGDMTNYEKLILYVETDGSLSPEDSVKKATQTLVNQFNYILGDIDNSKDDSTKKKSESKNEEDENEDDTDEAKESSDEVKEKVEELDKEKKTKKRGRPKKSDK